MVKADFFNKRILPEPPKTIPTSVEELVTYLSNSGAYNGGRLAEACTIYEKMLQLLCLKILERIPYPDRGGRRPYPLSAASAYVADKLLSRKIKHSSALTQKLVAQSTNVAEFTIRDHAEFMFSYDYEDIINDVSARLSSSFD